MNTADYRIGNLLRDKVSKALLEVVELTKEDVVTHVIDRSMFPLKEGWGLEPIPLTPEWLIKFGFKKEFNGCYVLDNYIVFQNINNIAEGIDEKGFYQGTGQKFVIEIKYVHQFQNLYYSIIQKELKLERS